MIDEITSLFRWLNLLLEHFLKLFRELGIETDLVLKIPKTDLSVKCWNIIKSEYLKIENYWKPTVLEVLYAYHRGLWIMFCKITSIIIPFIFWGEEKYGRWCSGALESVFI